MVCVVEMDLMQSDDSARRHVGQQQQTNTESSADDAYERSWIIPLVPPPLLEGLVVTRHNRVSFAPSPLSRRWTVRVRWVAVVLPRMHGTQRDAADRFVQLFNMLSINGPIRHYRVNRRPIASRSTRGIHSKSSLGIPSSTGPFGVE